MAKKTALERAEERINQLQTDRTNELQQHAARIEAANARAAKARADMETAAADGKLDDYKAAKLELIDAETEIEFSSDRTKKLHISALVDATESRRVIQEIQDEEQKAQEADEAEVRAIIAKLEVVGTRNKRRKEKLNTVLNEWHTDICKIKGDRQPDDNRKVFWLVENIINDNLFRQINGEEVGIPKRYL